MKTLLAILGASFLLCLTGDASAYDAEAETAPPPVAQPLVREGDLALQLARELELGTPDQEAEAESLLAAAGVAPVNGWIADYPVTPDVVGEVRKAIEDAAAEGKLAVTREQALVSFEDLIARYGLTVSSAPRVVEAEPGPPADNSRYGNETTINNYYVQQGPPVVTYYRPPPAYFFLYTWVPYPFFSFGFWFPGYYCLADFSRPVFVSHHVVKVVTNHCWHPRERRVVVIDPVRRSWRGQGVRHEQYRASGNGFRSPEARTGAREILRHSERARSAGREVSASVRPGSQTPRTMRGERDPGLSRPSPQASQYVREHRGVPGTGSPGRTGSQRGDDLTRPKRGETSPGRGGSGEEPNPDRGRSVEPGGTIRSERGTSVRFQSDNGAAQPAASRDREVYRGSNPPVGVARGSGSYTPSPRDNARRGDAGQSSPDSSAVRGWAPQPGTTSFRPSSSSGQSRGVNPSPWGANTSPRESSQRGDSYGGGRYDGSGAFGFSRSTPSTPVQQFQGASRSGSMSFDRAGGGSSPRGGSGADRGSGRSGSRGR